MRQSSLLLTSGAAALRCPGCGRMRWLLAVPDGPCPVAVDGKAGGGDAGRNNIGVF